MTDKLNNEGVVLRDSQKTQNPIQEKNLRPGNLAFTLSRKKKTIDFFLLIISGFLYSSIFPPLSWDFYAWFAIVPLFLLTRNTSVKSAFVRGLIWGYAWAVSSFFWLREIEVFIPFLIALILAFFPAIWCAIIPFADKFLYYPSNIINGGFAEIQKYRDENQYTLSWNLKDIHFCFILSAFWVLLEWLRSWIFTGLPWNLTAISQWKNPVIIQISDITGAYGVSFIIVNMNIALSLSAGKFTTMLSAGKYRRPIALYAALIIVMICIGYGTRTIIRNRPSKDSKQLKLAAIQADIPQCRMATEEQAIFALEKYLELTELAILSSPDIVVWPETAVPVPLRTSHPVSKRFYKELTTLARENNLHFLIGTIDFGDVPFDTRPPEQIPIHNSALLVDSSGTIVEKYHKIRLVPFGEFTPFGKYFAPLKKYFGMGRDLTAGKDYTIFNLPSSIRAGVNICYEDVFPEISRKLTKKGADMLFVLTNDAWYPHSSEPEQHFTHSIFRAVENRRRIVRSGNNNFTCVISPIGTIEDSIAQKLDDKSGNLIPDPSKKMRGYAVFNIELPSSQTLSFYSRYGDIFILALFFFLLLSAIEIYWKWKTVNEEIANSLSANQPS